MGAGGQWGLHPGGGTLGQDEVDYRAEPRLQVWRCHDDPGFVNKGLKGKEVDQSSSPAIPEFFVFCQTVFSVVYLCMNCSINCRPERGFVMSYCTKCLTALREKQHTELTELSQGSCWPSASSLQEHLKSPDSDGHIRFKPVSAPTLDKTGNLTRNYQSCLMKTDSCKLTVRWYGCLQYLTNFIYSDTNSLNNAFLLHNEANSQTISKQNCSNHQANNTHHTGNRMKTETDSSAAKFSIWVCLSHQCVSYVSATFSPFLICSDSPVFLAPPPVFLASSGSVSSSCTNCCQEEKQPS